MQRLSQLYPAAAACTGAHSISHATAPVPPGRLALSPEVTPALGFFLSQPGCPVTLGNGRSLLCAGVGTVPSLPPSGTNGTQLGNIF